MPEIRNGWISTRKSVYIETFGTASNATVKDSSSALNFIISEFLAFEILLGKPHRSLLKRCNNFPRSGVRFSGFNGIVISKNPFKRMLSSVFNSVSANS